MRVGYLLLTAILILVAPAGLQGQSRDGDVRTATVPPETGAEDFSYFAQEVPSFYFKLGAVRPGNTSGGHHTPTFRADDEAIPVGVRAMTAVVLEALAAGS